MALAHLGIEAASEPVGFLGIRRIGDGKFRRVPVLENAGEFIEDSWRIAQYLEPRAADRSLFPDPSSRVYGRFTEHWVTGLFSQIGRIVVPDIFDLVADEDHPYFEESRERWLGRPIETLRINREQELPDFRGRLEPIRRLLLEQPFLNGTDPGYPDYQMFGALQWARVTCAIPLVASDDPVYDWFQRCLDLYDGLGRREPGYEW